MVARLFPHFWDRNAHDALKLLLLSGLHGQLGGESEHPAPLGAVIKVCNGKLRTPLDSERIVQTDRLGSEGIGSTIGRRCNPEFSPARTYSFFVLRGTKGSVTVTVCPTGMTMLSPDTVKPVSGGQPRAAVGHRLSLYVTLYPTILISKARPVAVVVGNCCSQMLRGRYGP